MPDPADNATAWIGAIPRDGNYLILVTMRPAAAATPSPYQSHRVAAVGSQIVLL